jgi:hypothetical protein
LIWCNQLFRIEHAHLAESLRIDSGVHQSWATAVDAGPAGKVLVVEQLDKPRSGGRGIGGRSCFGRRAEGDRRGE